MPRPPDPSSRPGAESNYLAYLLRLWRIWDGDQPVWRASLEAPGSREARGFASIEAVFDFLRDQVDEQTPPGKPESTLEQGR